MKVAVDSNIIFSALLKSPNRYCDAICLSSDESGFGRVVLMGF